MWVSVLLGVLAVLLTVVAVIYFVEPARDLPSFFPGHTPHGTRARVKHGLAAAVVAALVAAAAWFTATRRRASRPTS